jgi:DNA polymerase I
MDRLHVLDGHGYIFRAYYALATAGKGRQGVRLTNSTGMPTGALLVYAQMLIRLLLDERPERIAVVFDAPGRSFRAEIDADYKAHRRETPEDLQVQLPYFRRLTEALGWPVIAIPSVEADDVIATLACRARERDLGVVIYSGDKDLMQLVTDDVLVIDSMRQVTYDAGRVEEKFGVPPSLVGDYLALVGDTSDNIPGVAGVGAKTAAKLLAEHGSIDGILAAAGQLTGKLGDRFRDKEQLERLARSRKLVKLVDDVELGRELDELVAQPWQQDELVGLLRELEFDQLVDRLGAVGGGRREAALEAEAAAERSGGVPAEVAATGAKLQALADAAREAGRVAIHVVTDGSRTDRAQLVGVGVATDGRPPGYAPLGHRYLGAPAQLTSADLAPLVLVLRDPSVRVICHDSKEARRALAACDIPLDNVAFDAMLASYLLDATTDAYGVEVVGREVGITIPDLKQLLGRGKAAIGFEALSVEEATAYAGTIAGALLCAADPLEKQLSSKGLARLFHELEIPLAALLADIERIGVTLDTRHLQALSDRVGGELAELERRIFELAGESFNLGSPKQLSALLFHKLGLVSDRMRKTKSGAYSTDAEVLDSLREAHPIVPLILEHRELGKLKGTYLDALPPLLNPRTGRLHTSFRQAVASTGRLSSTEPNLQNIPIRSELGVEIRRAFVAGEGQLLVSADYSQIELRVLAHLSRDPVLLTAFREGIDIHTQTAAEVFEIPRAEVGPSHRRVAKAVNYGLIYGQSDFGLARALGIPRGEARRYIERYFERLSRVKAYMEEVVERTRELGDATTILGRRRPIPGLVAREHRVRSQAERIAQNTPIQGSAADILKLAMLRVHDRLRRDRLPARMLLTVHDELVLEADASRAEEVGEAVREEMEAAYALDVPLVVELGIGPTWADAH